MANVEIYRGSRLSAADILEHGSPRVILATGAAWRRDGIGRSLSAPLPGLSALRVMGPEDIFAGAKADGPVVVYDDDHYYLGGLLAEKLRLAGLEVTIVTPAADVSRWTHATLEQGWIEERLRKLGVAIIEKHTLAAYAGELQIAHLHGGPPRGLPCATLVPVTMRLPDDGLYAELAADPAPLQGAGIKSVLRIGDCLAPFTIAAAVYAGHRAARELDEPPADGVPFKREMIALE